MPKWLRRTRGLEFHANRCESEYARTDRAKHRGNLGLYRDLTTILASSHLIGLSVALDLRSQRECLPDIPWDIGYYKCFTDLIANIAGITRNFILDPNESDNARLELTFDSRLETDGTARRIYRMYRTLPEWGDTSIFDTKVSFEGGPDPRLEMADLLAREAMKELDRKVTNARPEPRKSFQALYAAGKVIWIEHDRAYCERWREKVQSPQGQADREDYMKWLVDTKRVQNGRAHDNHANRMLFYSWLEKRDAFARRAASRSFLSLAARGESRRCIPAAGVAPRSNTAGILPRHALSARRIASLGSTRDFHHGLLGRGFRVVSTRRSPSEKRSIVSPGSPAPGRCRADGERRSVLGLAVASQ